MIVDCPNCLTKFNLPDEMVGPEGAKVRCGVCKKVFSVEAPLADDFPGFGESGAKPVWPVTADDDGLDQADETRLQDRFNDVRPSGKDFSEFGLDKPGKDKMRGIAKIGALVVVLMVMLGGVYGTAAYFFELWPFAKKSVKSAMEEPIQPEVQQAQQPQPAAPAPAAASMEQRLENVPFVDYTHYPVENPKVGKIFVIEGAVVNNNPANIGWIKIEAALYNEAGAQLLSKEIEAGPKIGYADLKILGHNEIESRLTSKQEILLNNGSVKPGEKVPFMVVFENIPAETKDYSLKVTSFQDVAPPPGTPAPAAPAAPAPAASAPAASAPAQPTQAK